MSEKADVWAEFGRLRRRQQIRPRLVAGLCVVFIPLGGLVFVGAVRHSNDVTWCGQGHDARTQACFERREARRWGPFLAFGSSADRSRHGGD